MVETHNAKKGPGLPQVATALRQVRYTGNTQVQCSSYKVRRQQNPVEISRISHNTLQGWEGKQVQVNT